MVAAREARPADDAVARAARRLGARACDRSRATRRSHPRDGRPRSLAHRPDAAATPRASRGRALRVPRGRDRPTPMRLGRCCASWRAAAPIATSHARARCVPTLLVHGEHDRLVCVDLAARRGAAPPGARRRGAARRRARAAARGSRPPRRGRRGVAGCEDGAMAGGAPGTAGPGNGSGLLGEPVREFVDDLTSVLGALRDARGRTCGRRRHRARRRTRGPGRRRGHDRRRRPPERRRAARLRRGARAVVRVAARTRHPRRSATAPRSASTAASRSRRRRCSRRS